MAVFGTIQARSWLDNNRALLMVLAAGLVVRLGLVWATAGVDLRIVDEQQYATLARNLAGGNGFAWSEGAATSMRPPLFPVLLAAVWRITGSESLIAIRMAHVLLSLANVAIVYLIGLRVFTRRTALLAACAVAFYPSLLFAGVLVLSETLFTSLLLLFVLSCLVLFEHPAPRLAIVTGMFLGAAALTRSIMWPFIAPLIVGVLAGLVAEKRARWRVAVMLFLGYAMLIGPWSYRNTRLQQAFTVVDTMGGLNLLRGNYAFTPEDRMWDPFSVTAERDAFYEKPAVPEGGGEWTEGLTDRWASRQALAYITSHPLTTARRTVLKFADFWGIEREFVAGAFRGEFAPPTAILLGGAALTALGYSAVLTLGVLGLCLARPEGNIRAHLLFVSVLLFVSGIHALVFGHSRYHLPLVPLMALYAAAAIDLSARRWRGRGAAGWTAAVLLAGLVLIWVRDLFFRDAERLAELAARLGFPG